MLQIDKEADLLYAIRATLTDHQMTAPTAAQADGGEESPNTSIPLGCYGQSLTATGSNGKRGSGYTVHVWRQA